jgi:3-hydroxymyristoyl/3-hydroxydecanoyl-(acyl carrier protein) dehydratase
MNNPSMEILSGRLLQMLRESAARSSTLHRQFLQVRQDALQHMRALIEMQIASTGLARLRPTTLTESAAPQAVFDSHQLDEFGTGQISRCLGPHFARYDGRHIPRIPNGDLKMMSRITAISGQPFTTGQSKSGQPASVTAEYDVPLDSWYLRDNAYPSLPYSLYMEIALQPCGFLSAYLDTYALVPCEAFFFRNLDGSARILDVAAQEGPIDLRGKTVTTRAQMLSSVVSGGTVIQRFTFELSCAGRVFYAGESTFGYFSTETMANQMGLDSGRPTQPVFCTDAGLAQSAMRIDTRRWQAIDPRRPHFRLSQNRLHYLDEVLFAPSAGRYGQGYLYASRPVDPRDWFYPYHFYGDPVMPGSLGVEAILEAMQAYAVAGNLGGELPDPHFTLLPGPASMTWRYRGQITQQNRLMELEIHLNGISRQAGQAVLLGDASLWVDGLRIYEIKNAAVGITQGEA